MDPIQPAAPQPESDSDHEPQLDEHWALHLDEHSEESEEDEDEDEEDDDDYEDAEDDEDDQYHDAEDGEEDEGIYLLHTHHPTSRTT